LKYQFPCAEEKLRLSSRPACRKLGILKLKYIANTIVSLLTPPTNYSFRHTANWIETTCVQSSIGNVLSNKLYQLMV